MTIMYSTIPDNLRAPGFYAEFDPSRANSGSMQHKLVLLGQRLATGSAQAREPMRLTRKSDGEIYFGRGSMLASMATAALAANPAMELWGIALDDLEAGVAAAGAITFSGAASVAGTLRVEVGNLSVRVGVAFNQAANALASAVVAAIAAATDLPVTAAINGSNPAKVDITARHKGTVGNDLQIRVRFEADQQPTNPIITVTPMSGGTGNPDIIDAIAAMGDEWYNWIVNPWIDATNMALLEAELRDRFAALRAIGARAFIAFRGTYGATATYGDSRNCEHVTCMGTGLSVTPPQIWAAVNAVVAGNSLMNDPAQQLTTLVLPGIQPPAVEDRFTKFPERNNLAFDGISTYSVDAGGLVRIENQLTMYQEDAQGNADDSMLHINVPELYEAYRREQKLLFAPHQRDKLSDDGNNIPAGEPVMTPKKGKGMLIAWYRGLVEERAWCEDVAHYEATILVEKQGNRLKIVDQPNWIDNMRQVFARSELVN